MRAAWKIGEPNNSWLANWTYQAPIHARTQRVPVVHDIAARKPLRGNEWPAVFLWKRRTFSVQVNSLRMNFSCYVNDKKRGKILRKYCDTKKGNRTRNRFSFKTLHPLWRSCFPLAEKSSPKEEERRSSWIPELFREPSNNFTDVAPARSGHKSPRNHRGWSGFQAGGRRIAAKALLRMQMG